MASITVFNTSNQFKSGSLYFFAAQMMSKLMNPKIRMAGNISSQEW